MNRAKIEDTLLAMFQLELKDLHTLPTQYRFSTKEEQI